MSSSALLTSPGNIGSASKPSASTPRRRAGWLQAMREFALPCGAISIVFVMLIPLPSLVLDLLLGLSMAAAVLVFLSAVQERATPSIPLHPCSPDPRRCRREMQHAPVRQAYVRARGRLHVRRDIRRRDKGQRPSLGEGERVHTFFAEMQGYTMGQTRERVSPRARPRSSIESLTLW